MMKILVFFYRILNSIIVTLPDVPILELPDGVQDGINNIFLLLGWLAPYRLYQPLFVFILALTVFRIGWAIFVTFKK